MVASVQHIVSARPTGNSLCATCHTPAVYNTPAHSLHESDSQAGQCDMPHAGQELHGGRCASRSQVPVPRPDLSMTTSAPNVVPVAMRAKRRSGLSRQLMRAQCLQPPGFPFCAGAGSCPRSATRWQSAAAACCPGSVPACDRPRHSVRAVGSVPATESANTLRVGLNSKNPLERIGALLRVYAGMPMQERYEVAGKLLGDSVRSVRVVAMEQLAGINRMQLTASQQREFSNVVSEYIAVQNENSDRAFAHVNLGNLYLKLGERERAEVEYRLAIDLESEYIPGYINLADYYRITGSEAEAGADPAPGTCRSPPMLLT